MPSAMFGLHNQTFVVTGASSGIGAAMCGFLSNAGANVIGIARRADRLDLLAKQLSGADQTPSQTFHPLAADLSDRSTLEDVADACIAQTGQVDGVINAAGLNHRETVDEISLESWDETLNLNLATPFFFSRALVANMKKRSHGKIINLASLQSSRAFANSVPYGASKGGVCQLTRAMAEAWSKDGINCNAIAPGFFPTELTAPVYGDADRLAQLAAQTAIGRNGELEDLRGPTLFFASSASDYVTGQTLYVDGGFTAK
ncbi:MAG: NAD(P)-dependent dehydrogenase (short-subunit alcohol dehydrogenase family) [Saprospiraceae bacterium]|jgi:NAD(P)-dependent dehydrogenase (short-subunit alcohol dehydrogenase family)